MRIEKEGFVLNLEGTWCEISNKYGVQEHGDVAVNEEDIPEGYAEKKLDQFIGTHKVRGFMKAENCEKKVAFDPETKEYIQLQAVKPVGDDVYVVQKFDNELYLWARYGADVNTRTKSWIGCAPTTRLIVA